MFCALSAKDKKEKEEEKEQRERRERREERRRLRRESAAASDTSTPDDDASTPRSAASAARTAKEPARPTKLSSAVSAASSDSFTHWAPPSSSRRHRHRRHTDGGQPRSPEELTSANELTGQPLMSSRASTASSASFATWRRPEARYERGEGEGGDDDAAPERRPRRASDRRWVAGAAKLGHLAGDRHHVLGFTFKFLSWGESAPPCPAPEPVRARSEPEGRMRGQRTSRGSSRWCSSS